MPVKFGPEGYSSASVRRYQDHRPPETQFDVMARSPHPGRSRALGVVLIVSVMIAAVFYLGRSQPAPVAQSAAARIVAKDTVPSPGGGERHVLGISVPMPGGGENSVVVECTEEQFRQFRIGDEIVAHYTAAPGAGGLVVTRIEPKPGPVEL